MSFLDTLVNSVKNLFAPKPAAPKPAPKPAAPAYSSAYNQQMAALDKIQTQLNPHIQQANKNTDTIHNYLAGTYNLSNYGVGPTAHTNVGTTQATQQGQVPSQGSSLSDYVQPQQPQTNYAQYLPYLNQLSQQAMNHPSVQLSSDINPYLNASDQIRQHRLSNEATV